MSFSRREVTESILRLSSPLQGGNFLPLKLNWELKITLELGKMGVFLT